MSVKFELLNDEYGVFRYSGESLDHATEALDEALYGRERGELNDRAYMAELEEIVAAEPDFIDGYAHLAFALYDLVKPKKALDVALRGAAVGNRLIPEGFSGCIEWPSFDNRPFLRALHGVVLSYVRLRRHRDAVTVIERMLAYNPNDNQGMRYLLGSEYLRAGEADKARVVLEEQAAYYPPYYYELALLHLRAADWTAAATALRLGFCENPYIAEMLCGNPEPVPLIIWHDSNFSGPELAKDYLAMYGNLWRRRPDFVAFVHWLYNHSHILSERAAYIGCMEELKWEHDVWRRGEILDRRNKLLNAIDDQFSEKLIVRRTDQYGRTLFPWMHAFSANEPTPA